MSQTISQALVHGLPSVFLANKYAKSFIRHTFLNSAFDISMDNFLDIYSKEIISNQSFDGNEIKAIQITKNKENPNYLVFVKTNRKDLKEDKQILKQFLEKEFNILIVCPRKQNTFGYKESFDLLVWIDYLSELNKNIYLYGEDIGANTIIYALNSKMNEHVKACVLDDPNPYVKKEILNAYCDVKDIHISSLLMSEINTQMKKQLCFTLDDLSLTNHLKSNECKICVVYSKNKNNNKYYEILKFYNQTKGIKKFYFTEVIHRNYKQENYFDVLQNFYLN